MAESKEIDNIFATSISKKEILDVDDIILQCIIFNAFQRQEDYFKVPPTASNRFDINMFNFVKEWIGDESISSTKKVDIILSSGIPEYFLPLFGKGKERLRSLRCLMKTGDIGALGISEKFKYWEVYSYEEKVKMIGLFMVVNQIFTDANHRTSGYFMKSMDISLDDSNIESLMKVFEPIHRKAACYPYEDEFKEIWISSNQNMHCLLFGKV